MRMWMCNPKILCQQHLLGEHNEIHKFIGHLRTGRRINGYINNNLISPYKLADRHEILALEMLRRKYRHMSPVDRQFLEFLRENYSDDQWLYEIDGRPALADLMARCPRCKQNRDDLFAQIRQQLTANALVIEEVPDDK